ncbi:MAG: ribosome maturation factor RimM [Deltaproteobacteria bacterium]|nr:ribosome maturation factor RimM [Deltaproteobacteria bacterium]
MKKPGPGALVPLARITKTQGLRGEFRAAPLAGESVNLETIDHITLRAPDGTERAGAVERARRQKSFVVMKVAGIDTIDAAQTFVGGDVLAPETSLRALDEGEYYWYQLVGLRVIAASGRDLGVIERLFATGSNDVLVVRDGDRERYIPYTTDAVAAIDLSAKVLRLTAQEGLEEL